MSYSHVFGPVISSRLGRSLGLDLLTRQGGEKICSFDCIYCEVGPNAQRVLRRQRHAPPDVLLQELAHWRAHHASPLDHVTLGGSGEPCLHSDLGAIITGVRRVLPQTPVAVLTNTSLFPDPQVRSELALADVVLPSLDSLVQEEFQLVNRPHPSVTAATVAEALLAFGREFQGRLYLEVLLCQGINDSERNLELLGEFILKLAPQRVDVVTLSRPGAYARARAVDAETLTRFRKALEPLATGEPETQPRGENQAVAGHGAETRGVAEELALTLAEEVYQSLRRRPQTGAQLAQALDAAPEAVDAALELLSREQRLLRLNPASQREPVFYKAV